MVLEFHSFSVWVFRKMEIGKMKTENVRRTKRQENGRSAVFPCFFSFVLLGIGMDSAELDSTAFFLFGVKYGFAPGCLMKGSGVGLARNRLDGTGNLSRWIGIVGPIIQPEK